MGLEHLNHSVSHEIAEEDGQPRAIRTIRVNGIPITFKVVTKPVIGLPWKSDVEYTYFWCDLKINGTWVNPNTSWSRSPREAMEESLQWWLNQIKKEIPYASDLFENCHALYGHNESGYWVIEGTHGLETSHTCHICGSDDV